MWVTPDGRRVYHDEANEFDVYKIFRRDVLDGGDLSAGTPIPNLYVSGKNSTEPYLSADQTEIWFSSNRNGQSDIFHATTIDGGFVEDKSPVIDTTADERAPVISADRRTLYFASASGRKSCWRESKVNRS